MKKLLLLALLVGAAPAAAELPVGTFTYGDGAPFTITKVGEGYTLSPAPGAESAPITFRKEGVCFALTWRDTQEPAGQFCLSQRAGVLDGPTEDLFAAYAVADVLGAGHQVILVPGGYQVVKSP